MDRIKFAAFIMTYERPQIILNTINALFAQTLPPQKILIVDNSESHETELLIKNTNDNRLAYHRVGYNAGPAGAAKIGLEKLAAEGYDWIYWGDDDNPPRTIDAFASAFSILGIVEEKAGIIGLSGGNYNINKATITPLNNDQLSGAVKLNSMAGGSTMLINAELVQVGIMPDENLFFGFEELDFCLSVQRAGYGMYVNGDKFLEYRTESGNLVVDGKKKKKAFGFDIRKSSLWREYYATRNLLYISLYKTGSKNAVIRILLRNMIKVLLSFKNGFSFGLKYAKLMARAIYDAFNKKMGMRVKPGEI